MVFKNKLAHLVIDRIVAFDGLLPELIRSYVAYLLDRPVPFEGTHSSVGHGHVGRGTEHGQDQDKLHFTEFLST